MNDMSGQTGASDAEPAPLSAPEAAPEAAPEDSGDPSPSAADESLVEELSSLIDNGRNYAAAELAFQKTRASLAGRSIGIALACVVVAIILLHIAFLALAVGLVMALEPLVGIWGAIGIVFGGLLIVTGLLGWVALKNAQKLGRLFSSPEEDG